MRGVSGSLAVDVLRGPLGVTALIATSVFLGYWGFRVLDGAASVGDSLYRTLQLFTTDAQVPAGADVPWQLEIARFLAPLSIAYAALAAVFALLRDQAQQLRARLFARNHVVVIGLGTAGARLARALRGSGPVVAVSGATSSPAAAGLRANGVAVFEGDGRDPAVLRAARVDRAKHIVVIADDDSAALEIVAALMSATDRDGTAGVHVAIEGAGLWRELHSIPLRPEAQHRRIEFFSLADRGAEMLVRDGEAGADGPGGTVVVRGEGVAAARLIIRLLRSDVFRDSSVSVESEAPAAVERELAATDAWAVRDGRLALTGSDAGPASIAFVCGLPEADAVTEAAAIARTGRASQVVAAVEDQDIELALKASGSALRGVRFVPTLSEILSARLFELSAIEVVALGRHADYLAQQRSRGERAEDNPSLVPWEELPATLKESNRRFAEGVASALAGLNAELVPLTGREAEDHLAVPPAILDRMAEMEHARWVRDLERDGWRATDGAKDAARKLHPLMVSWSELSEAEREKDRDAIRGLPDLLRRVGYGLRIPSEAD